MSSAVPQLRADGVQRHVEVSDGQVDHERQRDEGQHRVHRGQADVQCDVAAEDVAEQVCGGAAWSCRQQHHSDPESWGELEGEHQPEAN
jgi:hypothetical protein